MSKEEIRKLLGGYATNTLTESERNALFEAALDDQELFNALQQEQALRNLLDDPAARAEVRHALQQPSGGVRAAGQMRWWAFGGAASAVAAAVLFVVFRAGVSDRPTQLAMSEKAPSPVAPAVSEQQTAAVPSPAEPPQRKAKPAASPAIVRNFSPSAPAAAPPPIIPSPVQAQAVQSFRQQEAAAPIAGRVQDRIALANAPAAQVIGSLQAPLLRYSLVKLETGSKDYTGVSEADLKPGDLVRLQVSATLPGQLRLSRLDQTGEWQRVADVAVVANSGYTIPDSPIQVTDTSQKYRLTLETLGHQTQITTGIPGGPKRAMRAASAAQSATSEPAVVEITIGSKGGN
jgi:hypothetical protein